MRAGFAVERAGDCAFVRTRGRGGATARARRGQFVMSRGVTLYGSQGSRSPLVNWYANEIGLGIEMKPPSDQGNPHPFGQVPALRDGDLELWESGAILAYLGDKYGKLDTPEARAECGKWIVFANATLDPILFKENARGGVMDTGARDPNNRRLGQLNRALDGKNFLVRDTFSVADVAVCAYLLYSVQFFPDNSTWATWPNLVKYMGRCASREAYGKAFGAKVQQFVVQKCMSWVKP